MKAGSAQRS